MQTSPVTLSTALSSHDDQVVHLKRDRPIGQILAQSKGLEPTTIDRVLQHQRQRGGRFGEIAVAFGLVSEDDVFEALAQQFGRVGRRGARAEQHEARHRGRLHRVLGREASRQHVAEPHHVVDPEQLVLPRRAQVGIDQQGPALSLIHI